MGLVLLGCSSSFSFMLLWGCGSSSGRSTQTSVSCFHRVALSRRKCLSRCRSSRAAGVVVLVLLLASSPCSAPPVVSPPRVAMILYIFLLRDRRPKQTEACVGRCVGEYCEWAVRFVLWLGCCCGFESGGLLVVVVPAYDTKKKPSGILPKYLCASIMVHTNRAGKNV